MGTTYQDMPGVAKGLSYLHDPRGKHQRVLHCDVKSANILLDENMNAKVADFGLSKMGPANQDYSILVTNASGTPGYCDPLYMTTYTLTKESDVYSFGVVLFEVLCGRLCCEYINGKVKVFVPMWKQQFLEKKLDTIIFQHLQPQMHPASLELFSDVAFQCLHYSREERPTMSVVVEKLENALEFQEVYDLKLKLPQGYMEILMAARPPLKFKSVKDLNLLFFNGVFLNAGKTWFSMNDNGEHSEFVSVAECLIPEEGENYEYTRDYNSRFPVGTLRISKCKFKICLRPQFLSPHIMYTVNLVFKPDYERNGKQMIICLNYGLEGQAEQNFCFCLMAYRREDNWWTTELCQFTSDGPDFSFNITLHGSSSKVVLVEGIEFQPLGKVECQVSDNEWATDMQLHISESSNDDETYWEQMLPNDYQHIIEQSKDIVQWTTKKELYSIFSKGFLIVNNRSFFERLFNIGDQQWFSLDKRGKKCLTLSPRRACTLEGGRYYNYTWRSLPNSRFGEVLVIDRRFQINILPQNLEHILSPDTRYASYLVYKLPEGQLIYQRTQRGLWIKVSTANCSKQWYVYLISPQIPVVRPKVGENAYNPPASMPKIEDLPRQRSDGWMEVKLYQFQVDQEVVIPNVVFNDTIEYLMKGMMIQCIEIRQI